MLALLLLQAILWAQHGCAQLTQEHGSRTPHKCSVAQRTKLGYAGHNFFTSGG